MGAFCAANFFARGGGTVRRTMWVSLIACLALATLTQYAFKASAATVRTGAVAAAPPSASSLGLLAIGTGQEQHLGDVRRYKYVILQSWHADIVTSIHTRSPSTKVLTYLEGAATQFQTCSSNAPTSYAQWNSAPINYCWIVAHHPDWLLRDRAGRIIRFVDYPSLVAVDVANKAYQALWMHNAMALAHQGGYAGVYFDDVSMAPTHGMAGQMAKYTDQQYGEAMSSFGSIVGDHLRAAGFLAVANTGVDPWVAWQSAAALRMAPHLSMMVREFSVHWGGECGSQSPVFTDPSSNGDPDLSTIHSFRIAVERLGTAIGGIDYSSGQLSASDLATMQYGRASFLLTWNGRLGSAYFFRTCGTVDPANPAWTIDPGTPVGAMEGSQGMWSRPFSRGLVLLNPSPTQTVTYHLPSSVVYRDIHRNIVTGLITMPPRSASVLTTN